MTEPRILVTGASGMVGSNLLEHASLRHADILAPRSSELDLKNFDQVLAYLTAFQPTLIVHAAGKVGGIQANVREPASFMLDNLDMGRNVVVAARTAGVRRLINLGSSCMYPEGHDDALTEDMILAGALEPTNEGYALAKIATARLCTYIGQEDASFQFKTLIPCNLYGRHDKFDPSHSHLIPAIIHKIHIAKETDQATVEIWGDGTARREFMYAGDIADALASAIDRFDSLPALMNIGLGHDHTINQYYAATADVLGYCGRFVHDLSKPVGMARKLVDIKLQRSWGWEAKYDLRAGIEKTYQFYLSKQNDD